MKWHLLLVCLALGALLVGCEGGGRDYDAPDAPPIPTTPASAIKAADDAVAAVEEALATSDIEKIRSAVKDMERAISGVMSHLSDMDLKAGQEARQAERVPPPAIANSMVPAMEAAQSAFDGVLPPPNDDVAKVKEAIPTIKSGLDAVRDAAQ